MKRPWGITTIREVSHMNVGKLSDIAVAYARDHKVPLTRRQCRIMAADVLRRAESEIDRIETVRITTPDEAHTLQHSDPTGEKAVRNVQNAIDRLVLT